MSAFLVVTQIQTLKLSISQTFSFLRTCHVHSSSLTEYGLSFSDQIKPTQKMTQSFSLNSCVKYFGPCIKCPLMLIVFIYRLFTATKTGCVCQAVAFPVAAAVFSMHLFHLLSVSLLSVFCICEVISFPLVLYINLCTPPALLSEPPYLSSLGSRNYKTPENAHSQLIFSLRQGGPIILLLFLKKIVV